MKSEWTVGRTAECDIVVADASVSGRHCRLFRQDSRWLLEDLGSSNGTFVNGTRITSATPVSLTDHVTLGLTARLTWPDEMQPLARGDSFPAPHPTLVFTGREIVVGRDPSCDHVFDYPMISRRHARLIQSKSGVTVEDLDSSNGTYVNGKRIIAPVQIKIGDVVSLGSYELRLNPDGILEESDLRGRLRIEARGVTVHVPGKTLLENISLTIHPGEFVGLMGPSGAGKTTLMSAMNGYVRPSQGEVLFNGESLYGNYARFAIRMGYVPQDDIIHRDLTVGEALYYTAKLRLPTDYSAEDIERRVRTVLDQMALAGVRDVLIGSAEKKGISGGQRKRVNLAMELLTEPLVLFLDEPTSGLSSEDALMVMKVLRGLADSGKTILLTIHQPSLEVFRLLDNLTIVSKDLGSSQPGRLAYYGPAYPGAVTFFNPERNWPTGFEASPDEVLRGLGARPTEEWVTRFSKSDCYKTYVAGRASRWQGENAVTVQSNKERDREGSVDQWKTLVRRCTAIKLRDKWNSLILLAQPPVIALLIAITFGKRASQDAATDLETWGEVAQTVPIALFVMVLSGLWFGCSNSVREIVGEWAIYRRERMVNLRIPAYVGAKFAVLGMLTMVQCFVLVLIVHTGCGLKGAFLSEYWSVLLVSLIGLGIGLVVSAAARTSEAAVALVPLALLPMVMLGGVMIPLHDMPDIARPIAQVMPSRWAFEGLMETESQEQPHSPFPEIPASPRPLALDPKTREPSDMAEKSFPKSKGRNGVGVAQFVMLLMLASLYGAVHLILWKRDLH